MVEKSIENAGIEPALYLLPSTMSDAPVDQVLPAANLSIILSIKHYIVENIRSARRFLRRCSRDIDIDSLTFYVLDEHTKPADVAPMLEPLAQGKPMGVISEAGCPAVADPGADAVAEAHRRGYKVVPMVGPSSIMLALMASGFNGQTFAFAGYLPIDQRERSERLREMVKRINRERQTQIFIETPYRNNRLIAELAGALPPTLMLSVASCLTAPDASVVTKPLSWWRTANYNYDKRPTIFLLYQ